MPRDISVKKEVVAAKEKVMCTFENERRVVICDIAIHHVREAVDTAFGETIRFTPVPGQGTRVEARPSVDEKAFQKVTREALAVAQRKSATQTS